MSPEVESVSIGGYEYPTSGCRSCSARMVWAIVEPSGKAIPLDVLAAGDGNLVYVGQGPSKFGSPSPLVRYLAKDEEWTGLRYVTHFATCPRAAEHRRR